MMDRKWRSESDSLGQVRIPRQALYGSGTQRAVENFPISGLKPWRAWIWSMAVIKRAPAEVNLQLGLLPTDMAQAIVRASQEVLEGKWDDQFVVDPFQAGAGTSHNMNVNEVIANRATQLLGGRLGEYRVHPNDHVNMSQSTNDTVPTSIRLGCLWRLDELTLVLTDLVHALGDKAIEFDAILKAGRTHLQDALPVRLGQEFGAYARAVERDCERVQRAAAGLRRIGIGGTAVGSGVNAPLDYPARMVDRLSQLTGFSLSASDNLFESMQSMADLVDFSASLRTLGLSLIRIANDLRLLASGPATGLDEIRFPAVQPGSSIMPGKVNPVMAEMLDMAMFHVIGCDTAVGLAAQAGQLELNVMMPVIAHNLFEMMQVTIGAVRAFGLRAVIGLSANQEKAGAWLALNASLVTVLNPLIGYVQGAQLVKEAQERSLPILTVALERANAGTLRHRHVDRAVRGDEIAEAFADLRRFTEAGLLTHGEKPDSTAGG